MSAGVGLAGIRRALGSIICIAALVAASPSESPVADAAQRGDRDAVRALVQSGEDVNAAQADGMTALHWAALEGDAEMTQTLILAGATMRSSTRIGSYSPLHLASQAGSAQVVSALLEAGADPTLFTSTGVTALHFAAQANSPEAVMALVASGADIDARDAFQERTPLMFASSTGAVASLNALIGAGANPTLTTALKDYAEINRELSESRSLRNRVRNAEKDPEENQGNAQRGGRGGAPGAGGRGGGRGAAPTPPDSTRLSGVVASLRAAAGTGNSTAADDTPPVADPTPPADPPAFIPVSLGSTEQIGVQGGFTALHFAAREGRIDAALALVEAGADVNQATGGDETSPMLVATINGNYDLARMLLEHGADPNQLSDDGVGPLFATLNIEWSLRTWYPQPAMFRQQTTSYLELMQLLLDAGADPNQRTLTHTWYAAYNAGRMGVDFVGATPFWRAAYAADVVAMRLLVEHGADPNMTTLIAARGGPPRDVDPDIPGNQQSDDPEPLDPSGLPKVGPGDASVHPIHAASGVGFGTSRVAQQHRSAPGGFLASMKYLVGELGIDPNLADKDGLTPMHHSASRGDNETIMYLVSMGGDATKMGRRGQTTADQANSPEQRAQPFPMTIALLEKLGSKNNHNCRSCGAG